MIIRATLMLFFFIVAGVSMAEGAGVHEGARAPSFELVDQNGKTHRSSDYLGRWLVIYFYPKDGTPGCTTEACHIRDDYLAFREQGVAILGISTDDEKSHARFAEKYGLPFPLLADTEGAVSRRYGSLWSMGPVKFSKRHSFIIDDHGAIAKIYRKVDPAKHSAELQEDLRRLKREARGAYVPE